VVRSGLTAVLPGLDGLFALALRAARLADVDLREDSGEGLAVCALRAPLVAGLVDDGA